MKEMDVSVSRRMLEESICARTGLAFRSNRTAGLASKIERLMALRGTSDPLAYKAWIDSNPAAFSALLDEITIGETYFFRESAQFEFMRTQVLPDLTTGVGSDRCLKAWSAGCATGEEPYSLAILLDELGLGGRWRVYATDIAKSRLEVARKGRYRSWSFRGVPEPLVDRYFRRSGGKWNLDPTIRGRVQFSVLNLADPVYRLGTAPARDLDLILCRNVLIYFAPEAIGPVAKRLLDSLSPNGWLFLGASDPLLTEYVDCELIVTGAGVAYRRSRPKRGAEPAREKRPLTITAPTSAADRAERPSGLDPRAVSRHKERRQQHEKGQRDHASANVFSSKAAQPPVKALELELTDLIARVRSLSDGGDLEEAGIAVAAALESHPQSAELMYFHALLLNQAGHVDEALFAAGRAIYLDREFILAHMIRGGILAKLKDTAGARRAFINAEKLLGRIPPGDVIPAAGDETAGRLLEIARFQRRLLGEVA